MSKFAIPFGEPAQTDTTETATMPRGLQLVFIAIALVVIGVLLVYIWRQSRLLSEQRLREKKTQEFQARRRDEMVESIRVIAMAVEADQVEYSEACLRLKGLLEHVAPELLEKPPFQVLQQVHDKISHMPTHRARKKTDSETLTQLDQERHEVEQEFAEEIREAATTLRHYRFD
jgi:FtsZ-interacting cell division protein ZipA